MADSQNGRQYRLVFLVALVLIAGTLACYWQVWRFDYVNLDDSLYVYGNSTVKRGLTWDGLTWAFKSVGGANWNPLVWLSHMLDCQIYGLPAGGHHITNLVLHIANALLLFAVLRAMTGTLWRSALVAALFAWHPMHVESVAWISERKDTLSALFWLLTMWAYVKSARSRGAHSMIFYVLALAFFALGLMSKPMLVTLPLVLLLMDWWPLKRIATHGPQGAELENKIFREVSLKKAILEKIPFFVLSAAGCAVAILAQKSQGALGEQTLALRLENAAVSGVKYIVEFLWPTKLAAFYPYPDHIALWKAAGAAMLLALLSLGILWAGRQRNYLVAGWGWFWITLLPVIGLLQVGMQERADRYTYLPYIGLGLMLSWGLADLTRIWPRLRVPAISIVVTGLAACILATATQARYWKNSITLNERALAVTSGNYIAHDNLGNALEDQGNLDKAAEQFKEVIRLTPKIGKPYNDLGKIYALQGKMVEATEMFSNAVRLNPGLAQARWNLGVAWLKSGKVAQGLEEMKAGVALSPDDPEAHLRMAETLLDLGRTEEALPYCKQAAKEEPQSAHAIYVLGQAYLELKNFGDAEAAFKEVSRLSPQAWQALNALSWIYATCPQGQYRNGAEAVRLAEKACSATGRKDPEYIDTLAAAYAETGQFQKAVIAADETIALAVASHDAKLANAERKRLELYRAGKAYHEEP